MNGSTERKTKKSTFLFPILGPQRLEVPIFILCTLGRRKVFVLDHPGVSYRITRDHYSPQPYSLGPRRRFVWFASLSESKRGSFSDQPFWP